MLKARKCIQVFKELDKKKPRQRISTGKLRGKNNMIKVCKTMLANFY